MARTRYDEPDDESDDWDESDDYDDEGLATVPCPYCKAEIIEDAERCPWCDKYISDEDAPRESRGPIWVILMVLALLAAIILSV